jgi:hypothetical protein
MSQMDTRGAGPPGLRWCALCRAEYVAGVSECVDCVVPLVDAPPLTPEEVGDEEGEQLTYELDDLLADDRLAIDRQLAVKGILHAWDGATLVVAPWDEEEVDAILDDGDVDDEDEDDGEDEDQLVYDIADWDADKRAELGAQLDAAGIAYAFDDDGDLVVLAADEDRVDELLDGVENPDQLAPVPDSAGALDAVETVGALFVAADRLKNDPSDSEGTIAAADAARAMSTMGPPFGFGPPVWQDLVEQATELRRLLRRRSGDAPPLRAAPLRVAAAQPEAGGRSRSDQTYALRLRKAVSSPRSMARACDRLRTPRAL